MANQSETEHESVPSEEPPRFPRLSVLRMLWKRRRLILAAWFVASAISILIVAALPAVYRAEAVVLVDSQKIPENFVSPTVNGDVADRLALISQSIMTNARLLEITKQFNLYRDERSSLTQEELLRKMRDDISVNVEKSWTGGRMQAFRLAYQGRNAKVVTEVTNRLAGLYVEENLRARQEQAEGTVDFLRRQLQEAKQSLDEQEQRVAQFKQEHNGTLPEQQTSLLGTLGSLSVQIEGIQAAVARAQESKVSLEAALSAAESSEATLRAASGSALKPKSELLADQLRQLLLRYSPQYPDVQVLEEQIAEAEREELEESSTAQLGPSGAADPLKTLPRHDQRSLTSSPELLQVRERIANLRAQIAVANHELDSLEKEREQLAVAIAACQARISKLPLVEQEMTGLKRNYEESASNYNSLLQKRLAAGIATDMERSQKSERFTVIDAARIPEKPVKPERVLLASVGSLAGLIVAALVGFALEFRKQTFLGEWELPIGTPVLGRVPLIRMQTPVGRSEG